MQHGSILCGDYHKKVVTYLNEPIGDVSLYTEEIDKTTTDLGSILGSEINYNKLGNSLVRGFEEHFQVKLDNSNFPQIAEGINQTVFS